MHSPRPTQAPRRSLVADADACLDRGDVDRALELCGLCVDAFPTFVPAWFLMARIYLSADEPEAARPWLASVLQVSPGHREAMLLMAELAEVPIPPAPVSGVEDPEPDPVQAPEPEGDVAQPPVDGLASETLGDLYASQGDVEAAARIYRRVLARTGSERVKEKLGRLTAPGDPRIPALERFLAALGAEK